VRTVKQIQQKTGLAYTTVKIHLKALGAEQVPDTYPAQWRLPDGNSSVEIPDMPRLKSGKQGPPIAVPSISIAGDVVSAWNESRRALSAQIMAIVIEPTKKPTELIEQLTKGAQILATVALELQNVEDMPDWFTSLGGDLEEQA
jgi:hypothetical protein